MHLVDTPEDPPVSPLLHILDATLEDLNYKSDEDELASSPASMVDSIPYPEPLHPDDIPDCADHRDTSPEVDIQILNSLKPMYPDVIPDPADQRDTSPKVRYSDFEFSTKFSSRVSSF